MENLSPSKSSNRNTCELSPEPQATRHCNLWRALVFAKHRIGVIIWLRSARTSCGNGVKLVDSNMKLRLRKSIEVPPKIRSSIRIVTELLHFEFCATDESLNDLTYAELSAQGYKSFICGTLTPEPSVPLVHENSAHAYAYMPFQFLLEQTNHNP
nr:hypothetical protein Iba_chr01dCG0430 [Ipomoea batatas]